MLRFAFRHTLAFCIILAPLCALAGESPEQVLARHGLKQVNGMWQIAGTARLTERVQLAERLERRQRAMLAAVRDGRSVIDVMHDSGFTSALSGES